jgi:predicted O-methyltransferase YrrM
MDYESPYGPFKLASEYLKFRWKAIGAQQIHSPFIFDCFEKVFKSTKSQEPDWDWIESYRMQCLRDRTLIAFADAGKGQIQVEKRIRELAKRSAQRAGSGRILHKLSRYFEVRRVLELGTSLGIGSSYISSGMKPGGRLITIEGAKEISSYAKAHLQERFPQIEFVIGTFDEQLQKSLVNLNKVDMAFIDGHHQYEATLRYFEQILPFCHENSLIVLDDIHWSEGMKKAWFEICKHPQVSQSIDLFFLGIVFFRTGVHKEHFLIRT